ncbi:MAG TPA: hypothetical protein VFF49_08410 [Thermodesulfobacteriota bacterium]|nr:hypothetical protein [Thermodesulfobacteriota bacterium]
MRRYLLSLIATVFIVAMVVFAWTPPAKSGLLISPDDCLEYCEEQAICECAKILGGALRLTLCNIGASCEDVSSYGDFECVCDVDPLCKLWEKDKVVQAFPPENPDCGDCGDGEIDPGEECETTADCTGTEECGVNTPCQCDEPSA